jgi:hypothetical protein
LRTSLVIYILFFIVIQFSCTTEEEIISDNPNDHLSFSTDTITFDTVFTSLGSVSKRFLVRNSNANALIIDKIFVGGGQDSPYKIAIAGNETNIVENQHILGNDSLLILVSVVIDPSDEDLPFVVRDSIVFITNGNIQDIKLQSWGQNANFLGDSVLACDMDWNSDRPYYLYGSILVDSLCTLTIEKGTQIFSSFDSFIFIKGSLITQGTSEERVLFRNERLDPEYADIPGQWGGIIFLEGSHNNLMEFTDIRNVQYGVRLGTPDQDTIPDLLLKHVRIENSAVAGITAYTSDLKAENTLVNTSTGYVVGNFAGGHYIYNHCTFANYPINFVSGQAALILTDQVELEDGSTITDPLNIQILNSIVWGTLEEEIVTELYLEDQSRVYTENSIFKTSLNIFEGEGTFLSNETDFMLFKDIDEYDYTPDSLSPAIDNAKSSDVFTDLFGQQRDSLPDIGAIEYLTNE